jgi:Glycosyl transferase family 11
MITCVIMGGLGNQLFQIYTTMALSIQMKTSFGFPSSKMQNDKRSVTYWGNFLKELKKSASIADITRLQYPLYKEADFKYNKITISPDIMKNRGGVLLYGYYQSYKYFEKEYETICKYIKLEESKNEVRKLYDDKYFNSNKKIISMHFRLGDYKSLQYCHPILDVNYYINSLRFILKKEEGNEGNEGNHTNTSKKWLVLYFCEDEDILYVETKIKVIKEVLSEYSNKIEFERATSHKENTQISDWKQLLLMSCCHHNIIANSSYSWWAAYFNNNHEKQVCYPEKWFGPQLAHNDTSDLCPPSWNKITF